MIFTAPSGAEYAVNTSAHGVGYLGITAIWKRSKSGEKVDIEPLLKRGLVLCKGNPGVVSAPRTTKSSGRFDLGIFRSTLYLTASVGAPTAVLWGKKPTIATRSP